MLSMMQAYRQVHHQELSGGVTTSIFPEIEAFLQEKKNIRALRYAAPRNTAEDYHSVIDWLYISTFPNHRKMCMAFYDGKGPPVREIISEAQRRFDERVLFGVLRAAVALHQEKERMDWGDLVWASQTQINLETP